MAAEGIEMDAAVLDHALDEILPPLCLPLPAGPPDADSEFSAPKSVTFNIPDDVRNSSPSPSEKKRHHSHRRANSVTQPLPLSKLLKEEISQLNKKKTVLEQQFSSDHSLKRWDKKDRKKLQGAIEETLTNKRKAQLKHLRKRAKRRDRLEAFLERRPSLNDLKKDTNVFVDASTITNRKRSTSNGQPAARHLSARSTDSKWEKRTEKLKRTKSSSAIRKTTLDGMFPSKKNKVTKIPTSPRSSSISAPGSAITFVPPLVTTSSTTLATDTSSRRGSRDKDPNALIEIKRDKGREDKPDDDDSSDSSLSEDEDGDESNLVDELLGDDISRKSETLEALFKLRPTWGELVEKNIGKDEKKALKRRAKCKKKLKNLVKKHTRVFEKRSSKKTSRLEKSASTPSTITPLSKPPTEDDDSYLDLWSGNSPDGVGSSASQDHGDTEDELLGSPREEKNPRPPKEISFFDLDFGGPIGGGCFGRVYEAHIRGERGRVAVKILKRSLASPEKAYTREVEALTRTLESPHTVGLRGYCADPYYCVVTEYCEGGSLDNLLHPKQAEQTPWKMSNVQAVQVARQIAAGMVYLHSLKPPILHRDLSAGNIFLRANPEQWSSKGTTQKNLIPVGKICIGDFGVAVAPDDEEFMKTSEDVETSKKTGTEKRGSLRLSKNGNPRYRAPEVNRGEPYSLKADVYSFGNLFFELLTGERPFEACVEDAKIVEWVAGGLTPRFPKNKEGEKGGVDKVLKTLVRQCWEENPEDRPSFKTIVRKLDEYLVSQEQAPL